MTGERQLSILRAVLQMGPLVSVVIATYNMGRYLPETLDSVLAQRHRHIEIIVVDDGSTDDTAARIAGYLPRVEFVRTQHGGLAAARNIGLQIAKGDYIALLDADDLWLPEKLAVQLAIAQRNPESGLIVCNGVEFTGQKIFSRRLFGHPANPFYALSRSDITGNFHRRFISGMWIACPAQTLLPRRVWQQIGEFKDSPAQDYDYYLRVSSRFPLTLHHHSLVRWRYHRESMSGPRERRMFGWRLNRIRILTQHVARCDRADRVFVERRLRFLTRLAAARFLYYGILIDSTYATEMLAQLLGLRPDSLCARAALEILSAGHHRPRAAPM